MKFKELIYLLGIKPKPREYGFEIAEYALPGYGEVRYANWLHPKMEKQPLSIKRINILKRFLSDGDAAIDIGAHVGDTSVEMALAAGPGGTVFAFEPNRYAYRILEENAALNPELCTIIPFMYAAAESDTEMVFKYSDPGFCNGGEFQDIPNFKHAHLFPLPVTGKNISSLLLKEYPDEMARLKYIKIDTEGADYRVLKTLEPLVKSTHPHIRTEINRHMPAGERLEYWNYLLSLGYSVNLADEDNGPGDTALSEENIGNAVTYDIWAIPNN